MEDGGAEGIRTPDPHNAIVVLYQLSYDPSLKVRQFTDSLPFAQGKNDVIETGALNYCAAAVVLAAKSPATTTANFFASMWLRHAADTASGVKASILWSMSAS
jgi:hypothetical protein